MSTSRAADGIAAETGRRGPEVVVLGVRPGVQPGGAPPVRIFIGTEGAQFRPERVLIWSIERVRDPSRVYEIHLLKELVDFDRSRWTTGFTNYRFAIPEFAGAKGRAIYNDEDQIYLSDPAELFDLDMGGHGYLAIAPQGKVDSAVMLIDCARMAEVWTVDAARSQNKKNLLARARKVPGLRGDLPAEWHARDDGFTGGDAFVLGRTKLLHYTTLHTQPWHPLPERFVYRDNPVGEIWHDLEAEADAAGFQVFSRAHPSERYRVIAAGPRPAPAIRSKELAAAVAELAALGQARAVHDYDPLDRAPDAAHDGVVWSVPPEAFAEDDLSWMLDEALAASRGFLAIEVDGRQAEKPVSGRQTSWLAPPPRWVELVRAASRRRPKVHWHLLIRTASGIEHHHGGGLAHPGDPVIWLLSDGAAGTRGDRLRGLAEALGYGWQSPSLEREQLSPPWPDLVLSSGERSGERARWIRSQSQGRTRIVQLGAGAGARTEGYDLVITTRSQGFFPDSRRLELLVPLPRFEAARLGVVAANWKDAFEGAPAPRRALLIDGTEGLANLDWDGASALGECIKAICEDGGGSVFTLLGPHLSETARRGITVALHEVPGRVEVGTLNGTSDAYLAHLALADELIVAEDEEDLIGDACSLGKPIRLVPVESEEISFREQMRRLVAALASAGRTNDRGTTRPQQGLERFCSRLIAEGRVDPPRDLEGMKQALLERRVAVEIETEVPEGGFAPLDELGRTSERIRSLLGL